MQITCIASPLCGIAVVVFLFMRRAPAKSDQARSFPPWDTPSASVHVMCVMQLILTEPRRQSRSIRGRKQTRRQSQLKRNQNNPQRQSQLDRVGNRPTSYHGGIKTHRGGIASHSGILIVLCFTWRSNHVGSTCACMGFAEHVRVLFRLDLHVIQYER
jgi:hypothetical protein